LFIFIAVIFSADIRRERLTVKVQSARAGFFWPEKSLHRTTGSSSTFDRTGRHTSVLNHPTFLEKFDAIT